MAAVSGFSRLPAELRAWLLGEWRRCGYAESERLARELAERLAARPDLELDPPDQSTVWRWGQKEKDRAEQVRFAAEVTAATLAAIPDNDEAARRKIGAMVEMHIVHDLAAIQDLRDATDPVSRLKILAKIQASQTARDRAEVERIKADLARERFDAEQAARLEEREKAAETAGKAALKQGVSPAGIDALKQAIMGAL